MAYQKRPFWRGWPPAHTLIQPSVFRFFRGYRDRSGERRGRSFQVSVLVWFLRILFLLLLIVFLGSEVQRAQVKHADSTSKFYTMPEVCGVVAKYGLDNSSRKGANLYYTTKTFDNETVARENSDTVVVGHCGDCGACSNPHDIGIYNVTRNDLFESTKKCAMRSLIWGRRTSGNCMDREVGFTPECNQCWVDNIVCDLRMCFFVCLWDVAFSSVLRATNSSDDDAALNPCTECDEKRCGPAFIHCAGANRRRSGIISDIARAEESVCTSVDREWWDRKEIYERWDQSHNPFPT